MEAKSHRDRLAAWALWVYGDSLMGVFAGGGFGRCDRLTVVAGLSICLGSKDYHRATILTSCVLVIVIRPLALAAKPQLAIARRTPLHVAAGNMVFALNRCTVMTWAIIRTPVILFVPIADPEHLDSIQTTGSLKLCLL